MVRRRRRVRFSRAAPRGSPKRGHRPTVKMAGSHPADAGSTPAVRSVRCGYGPKAGRRASTPSTRVRSPLPAPKSSSCFVRGDRSMVGYEHARLVMGVRFPLTAPREPVVLLVEDAVCKTVKKVGFDSRPALHALEAPRKGGRLLNGDERVRLPPGALAGFHGERIHLVMIAVCATVQARFESGRSPQHVIRPRLPAA